MTETHVPDQRAADLITRLRTLARAEHDDLSIADEAADELERLRAGRMPMSMVDPLKHWEPIESGEAARCECAQVVDGQWYAPRWGADTLAAMLEDIEAHRQEAAP